ncbi:hypothetical protein WJ63_01575 [Burkholderia pyrrocinia]|nr:hypothetical protein WJ63_01575 [Burkholderia pyrrocinia]
MTLRSASQISLSAASSDGKWPRALMILRSCMCSDSIALVVYTIFRISGAKAKNGMTCSQARRQNIAIGGYFVPHGLASNTSSATAAASAGLRRVAYPDTLRNSSHMKQPGTMLTLPLLPHGD